MLDPVNNTDGSRRCADAGFMGDVVSEYEWIGRQHIHRKLFDSAGELILVRDVLDQNLTSVRSGMLLLTLHPSAERISIVLRGKVPNLRARAQLPK